MADGYMRKSLFCGSVQNEELPEQDISLFACFSSHFERLCIVMAPSPPTLCSLQNYFATLKFRNCFSCAFVFKTVTVLLFFLTLAILKLSLQKARNKFCNKENGNLNFPLEN